MASSPNNSSSPPPRASHSSIPFNLNTPPTPPRQSRSNSPSVSQLITQGEKEITNYHALRDLELVKAQLRKANEALDRCERARALLASKADALAVEHAALQAAFLSNETEHSRAVREIEAKMHDADRSEKEARAACREEAGKRSSLADEVASLRRANAQQDADLRELRTRSRELEQQLAEAAAKEEARVAQLEDEKRALIDQAEAKTLALVQALRQVQEDMDLLQSAPPPRPPAARPEEYFHSREDFYLPAAAPPAPAAPDWPALPGRAAARFAAELDGFDLPRAPPAVLSMPFDLAQRLPPARAGVSDSVHDAKRRVQRAKHMLDW